MLGGLLPFKDIHKRREAIRKSRAKRLDYYNALSREWKRKATREHRDLMRRYGLSAEDFNALFIKAGGACMLCGKIPQKTKTGRSGIHIDHDHVTKVVRGLVCARCNTFLGYADKSGFDDFLSKVRGYLCK